VLEQVRRRPHGRGDPTLPGQLGAFSLSCRGALPLLLGGAFLFQFCRALPF
jgi:hypothetical protein